jgi:hypothetical protein
MPRRRPFYVTLVGIYLVFFGLHEIWFIYSLWRKTSDEGMVLQSFLTAPTVFVLVVGWAVAEFASGIGVFRGANWARWLWSGWWIFMLVFDMATGRTKDLTIPAVLLEAATTALLFLPGANAYFDPEGPRSS